VSAHIENIRFLLTPIVAPSSTRVVSTVGWDDEEPGVAPTLERAENGERVCENSGTLLRWLGVPATAER